MANQYINLPAPAGNGAGAAVDVSNAGALKTIVVGGGARATVNIEINNAAVATDGSWAPIASFQNSGQITLRIAARWMRARVVGYNPYYGGQPEVNVGCTDDGAQFASLTVPSGNGAGAPVNTSALGLFKSVQVGGPFRGSLVVEVSEDGTEWGSPFGFQTPGVQSQVVAAKFMRVVRSGVPEVNPGQPIVNVAATDDFQGDDGVAISAGTQSVATGTVKFADSNGIAFGMSASSQVTASYDGLRAISAGTTNRQGLSGLSFANGSGVSFGLNGSTLTASVVVGGGVGISAGTTNAPAATGFSFSNGSGVSFGLNGSTLTASISPGVALSAGTTNTPNATGFSFSNGSNVSFGLNGSTLTASVADPGIRAIAGGTQTASSGTVLWSNSNGLSFGLSGSSRMTASYASYNSFFGLNTEAQASFGVSVNTLSLMPVTIPNYINVTGVAFNLSMNLNSGSTGAWTHSLGIYTLSGVSANLASSTSSQFSFTSGSETTASNVFGGASGQRYRTIPFTAALTPGLYLFAFHLQTSGGNSVSLSYVGNGSGQAPAGTYQGIETNWWLPGMSNSSFTSGMPASIAASNTNYQRTGVGLRGPLLLMFGTT